jgi:hypothetical protein
VHAPLTHKGNLIAFADFTVEHAHLLDDTPIRIEIGIEDEGPRILR